MVISMTQNTNIVFIHEKIVHSQQNKNSSTRICHSLLIIIDVAQLKMLNLPGGRVGIIIVTWSIVSLAVATCPGRPADAAAHGETVAPKPPRVAMAGASAVTARAHIFVLAGWTHSAEDKRTIQRKSTSLRHSVFIHTNFTVGTHFSIIRRMHKLGCQNERYNCWKVNTKKLLPGNVILSKLAVVRHGADHNELRI